MILPWTGYAARVVIWSTFLNEKISYIDAFRVVVTSDVASALSPTLVGGAPFKAGLLLHRGYKAGNVGFMMTYGVIEDIVFYATGIVLAGVFSDGILVEIGTEMSRFFYANMTTILVTIIMIMVYIFLSKKQLIPLFLTFSYYVPKRYTSSIDTIKAKWTQSIHEMKSNFALAFSHGKSRMILSIFILFLQWMSKLSVLLVILHAFQIDFDTIQLYLRQWVVFVTMLFVPTPGASGGAEALFILIFGKSIPSDITFLMVSLWRMFTYYFILLSAVILYTILSFWERKSDGK